MGDSIQIIEIFSANNAPELDAHVYKWVTESAADIERTSAGDVAARVHVATSMVLTRVWHDTAINVWYDGSADTVRMRTVRLAGRVKLVQCDTVLTEWTRNW